MSMIDRYNFISKEIHLYFGLSVLIVGLMGSLSNVIIFVTLKTFRETVCGFYLTFLSIISIGQMLTGLLIRVLSQGFHTNISQNSSVCKIQTYLSTWCSQVLITTMCVIAFDQYLSISNYRNYSQKRLAKYAILLNSIFWSLYCIGSILFFDVSNGICTIINSTYGLYSSRFHLPVLAGLLPLSTMFFFSLLAFYQTHLINTEQRNIIRLSRDKQLTKMSLCHLFFIILTRLPYIVYSIYALTQINLDPVQMARNNLINSVTVLINYSSFSVSIRLIIGLKFKKKSNLFSLFKCSFYIYFCVSERFRKQFFYVLIKLFRNHHQQQQINNQVAPISNE